MNRHVKRFAAVSACAVLALGAIAVPVDAGKGGKGGGKGGGSGDGSTVSLVVLDGSAPNFGDAVTFEVNSSTYSKWVTASCYQEGTLVYSETRGFYPEYPWGQTYQLGPTSMWTGGGASCEAELYTVSGRKQTKKTLASTSFSVNG